MYAAYGVLAIAGGKSKFGGKSIHTPNGKTKKKKNYVNVKRQQEQKKFTHISNAPPNLCGQKNGGTAQH